MTTEHMNDTVLATSSFAGMRPPGAYQGAEDFIADAEHRQLWPVKVRAAKVLARDVAGDLEAPKAQAIVGEYLNGCCKVLGMVGGRYHPTSADSWRDTIRAACEAGAVPVMAHAWGSKVLAQFDIGSGNGVRTNLALADSFDGSTHFIGGDCSYRVACANAIRSLLSAKGDGDWAKIRHTSTLEERIAVLVGAIQLSLARGREVLGSYRAASDKRLTTGDAEHVFDLLFPRAADDAPLRQKTIAQNRRNDATAAMALPCNDEGPTVATLWNAATFIVDRKADGSPRPIRGGEALDSMLFGTRGQRVAEIQSLIEVVMADGTIQSVPFTDATAFGVDSSQLGASILASMLD